MSRFRILLVFLLLVPLMASAQPSTLSGEDMSEKVDNGEVMDIKEDMRHNVWIATLNGLVCYTNDSFALIPLPSLTHHPFPAIHSLAIDSAGKHLWIGAWNHLYCYDLHRERFITIADSMIYQITRLRCDTPGSVLAYTEHGLYKEVLSDSFPEGQTLQLSQKAYYRAKAMTREEVKKIIPLKSGLSKQLLLVVIAAFACLLVMAIIFINRKRRKMGECLKDVANDNAVMPSETVTEDFAKRAEIIVDRHLQEEDFGIEQMAAALAVSRAQLFRKMKATNGMTPSEFLSWRRMIQARHLLSETSLPIADIAVKVGISDVSNFRRTYIKVFGNPPSR